MIDLIRRLFLRWLPQPLAKRIEAQLHLASHRLFRLPPDGSIFWSLEPPRDRRSVDVLRIGACEFRSNEASHTVTAPIGWPLAMADELERHGIGLGFQNIWAWNIEEMPATARALKKRRRLTRSAPDVVWLQAFVYYAGWHILGYGRRMRGIRENGGRWIGPLIFPLWRWLSFVLPRFGKPVQEKPDWDHLAAVVRESRELWPDAVICIQEPMTTPAFEGLFSIKKAEAIRDQLREFAREHDLEWVPQPPLGRSRRLRGANGYNLNDRGSKVAGEHYARWLLEHPALFVEAGERPEPQMRL